MATVELCEACRQRRGGYGDFDEHPPAECWEPVAKVSWAPWSGLSLFERWYHCRVCGAWWYGRRDPREQTVDYPRLPAAADDWFAGDATPATIIASMVQVDPTSGDGAGSDGQIVFRVALGLPDPPLQRTVGVTLEHVARPGLHRETVDLLFVALHETILRACDDDLLPLEMKRRYAEEERARRERFAEIERELGHKQALIDQLERLFEQQEALPQDVRGAADRAGALIAVDSLAPLLRWLEPLPATDADGQRHAYSLVARWGRVAGIRSRVTHDRNRHVLWMPDAEWDRFLETTDSVRRFERALDALCAAARLSGPESWETAGYHVVLLRYLIGEGVRADPAERRRLGDALDLLKAQEDPPDVPWGRMTPSGAAGQLEWCLAVLDQRPPV